jgi:hypothetical protein
VRLGVSRAFGGEHGDRLADAVVAVLVAGLLLTTCGPTAGDDFAAGSELSGGGDLAELAPEASPELRAEAFAASDKDGDGALDPDELDAFFAALLAAQRRADAERTGTTTTVPAFVPPGEIMPAVDTDDPTLFMVGDSVLQASYPTVQRMLPSWDVEADTRIGRRPDEGAAVVEDRSSDIGDVAVVLLGHNYASGEGFGEEFSRIMRELWHLARVVWVTVAEWSPAQREVNELLRAAPEVWPNIVVADWAELTAANPGYLTGDRVHLTGSGVLAIADLMARAVGPGPIEGVPGIVTVDVPEAPGGGSDGGSSGTTPPTWVTTTDTRPVTTAPTATTTVPSSTTTGPTSTTLPKSTTIPDSTTTSEVPTTEPPPDVDGDGPP